LLGSFERAGKPIGLVGQAPSALRHVEAANGNPLAKGRKVTGFTNGEEAAVGLSDVVLFLIEEEFKAQGTP
jgi:putative intracellular protease/amidase